MKLPNITFEQVEHTFFSIILIGSLIFFAVAFVVALRMKDEE